MLASVNKSLNQDVNVIVTPEIEESSDIQLKILHHWHLLVADKRERRWQ